MNKKRALKYFWGLAVIFTLVIGPYFINNLMAKEVVFKAVGWLPKTNPTMKHFQWFVEDFNKEFKGEAAINWVGGPDVIPMFQLHESVRTGMIDMVNTSCSFYVSLTPVSYSIMFSNKTHDEKYEAGFFDAFAEIHEKVGLIYLGETTYAASFYIYLNEKIKSPDQLAGKKIRVFPAIAPFIKALGATPVNLKSPDIYTAMERGVIDAFVMSTFGVVKPWSWHEVTKYVIVPSFYRGSTSTLVNPKSWNRLSKDLQKRIIDWKYKVFDPKRGPMYKKIDEAQDKLVFDNLEKIEFSPADTKRYLDLAYESAWKSLMENAPDLAPKLKKLLVK